MRAYHIRICLTPKLDKSRSHPDPSGTTFTPSSLWQHLPSHSQRRVARRGLQVSDYKGSEDYRYGPLRLEWIDFENMSFAQAAQGPVIASFSQNTRTKSGQTELPEGIVRLFRDASSPVAEEGRGGPSASTDASNPLDSESKRMLFDGTDADGVTVGVLAVPSWMSASDFLMFVAPAQEGISHLRMIRDCAPDRSVVLIKFRKEEQAIEFAEAYNGRLFNSMESETCHVVRVASVSVDNDDSLSLSIARLGSQAPAYELPTCPVCLERMDSAVTGLVTVPCSHTFHCSCLSKWGGGRCPVCRYSQTLRTSHPTSSSTRSSVPIPFADPSLPALSRCRECSSTTNLWICLICGNIGCGRYGQAHAHAHYTSTAHLYALELETQRTWDYASDQYVHRLIQNKADGKLVELPSASMASGVAPEARGGPTAADALTAEKIEAIGIEYSYLLSSQLDTQRTYYEDQARALQAQIDSLQATMAKFEDTATRLETSQIEASRAVQEAEATRRERVKAEAKADKLTELARRLERELKEERAVSAGLLENLEFARKRAEEAERAKAEFQIRVQELEDQVRDVMFFLEARDKIESGDGPAAEAAGGSVEIASPPNQGPGKKKKKR